MRRPSYASVVATLALAVALGGTSYAAVKITGKDVKNGSLTGKDLKKRSVPLDRLSGSLPTQLDPGQFVPSTGLYTVSVGPGGWQSLNPGLKRSDVFGSWTSSTTDDGAMLLLDAALPTTTAGRAMRLRAVTMCWDATMTAEIHGIVISTFREDAAGDPVDVLELEDPDDHAEKTCERYPFASPVTLAASTRVSLRLGIAWTSSGSTIHIGGATFELDRA
jgi:hypothetical protein